MSSDTSLTKARNAHKSGSWSECLAACERAIAEAGAAPSDDWIAARLILGSAVCAGRIFELVEIAIGRVAEVLTVLPESDVSRVGPARRILGYLFEMREQGTKSANLTLAIDQFEQALVHLGRHEDLTSWAHLKVAIALDLRERLAAWAEEGVSVRDDKDYQFRRGTLERGLDLLEEALAQFPDSEYPEEHGEVTGIIASLRELLAKLPADEPVQERARS